MAMEANTPPVVTPSNPPVVPPAPKGSVVVIQSTPVAPSNQSAVPNHDGCPNHCPKDVLPIQKDGYFKSIKTSIATKYNNLSGAVADLSVVKYLKDKKNGGWSKLTTTEKTVGVLAAAATLALATYVTYKIYKAVTAKKEQKKSVRYNRNN